jgi:fumarate reductase subunit D
MKASHEPVFWALFGAGGMLAALIGPVLVFITGLAVPLGIGLPRHAMDYGIMLGFARNPFGKIAISAVIALFLFHGCHRMLHSLHDLGVHAGGAGKIAFYGFAIIATLVTAALLLRIGF